MQLLPSIPGSPLWVYLRETEPNLILWWIHWIHICKKKMCLCIMVAMNEKGNLCRISNIWHLVSMGSSCQHIQGFMPRYVLFLHVHTAQTDKATQFKQDERLCDTTWTRFCAQFNSHLNWTHIYYIHTLHFRCTPDRHNEWNHPLLEYPKAMILT